MGITILDRQSTKLKKRWIRDIVKAILEYLDMEKASLSLVFVNPEEIKEYNKKFRGVNSSTDVLSFPSGSGGTYLGDIIICPCIVKENSVEYGVSFEEELVLVIIHGILHLLGYRDYEPEEKKIMEEKQKEVLDLIKERGILNL